MTDYSTLDPEIAAHLERVQATMATAHHLSAVEMREAFHAMRIEPTEIATVHEVRDLAIPAPHGSIKARFYKPDDKNNLPLLVWYHGGGWVLGDLDSADMTCRDLASKSGCSILSIDYRLAPEHPFPAAYDDAVTSLRYAFDNASALGADSKRIAIGGDSAGANLAACTSVACKDLDVQYQLLIYPVIEADFGNASCTENADHYFLTLDLMKWFWHQYIPVESNRSDVRVAPLNGDLTNLPPAYLLTVKFDPLRDEGLKYAEAMKQAGVQVATDQATDTVHGFFTMPTSRGDLARSEASSRLKLALM